MFLLGTAAVMPFVPIVAKQTGISATALGTGFSLIPVFTFIFNPLMGFLVDYFQNVKVFLIALLITSSLSYASIVFIPAITYEAVDATYLRISHINESESLVNISKPFEGSCLVNILQNYTECKLEIPSKDEMLYNTETNIIFSNNNITYDIQQVRNINQSEENIRWITFYIPNMFLSKKEDIPNSLTVQCSPPIDHCSFDEPHDILAAYQLWVFLSLVIIASIANISASSLNSVACFELLGANHKAYGRQRLYGTIGWGIVGALSGYLNDLFEKSFISVIYLIGILRSIDISILCLIPITKAHASPNMSRDLRIIFTSIKILVFSSGVAFVGLLGAIINVFEFWFLEDIGASRTLLGLIVLVQCLIGEVPFLYFSEWFIDNLGPFICFTDIFLAFLLRLVLYYFIRNPWLVLPIDVLHGITFGLFHGTMACFAKENAPKGLEATLLGFFSGLYLLGR